MPKVQHYLLQRVRRTIVLSALASLSMHLVFLILLLTTIIATNNTWIIHWITYKNEQTPKILSPSEWDIYRFCQFWSSPPSSSPSPPSFNFSFSLISCFSLLLLPLPLPLPLQLPLLLFHCNKYDEKSVIILKIKTTVLNFWSLTPQKIKSNSL